VESFLEAWLSEAPLFLQRELSAEVQFAPAEQLPAVHNAISLAVTVAGARSGRFAILGDRDELHALLTVANAAEAGADAPLESELWQGLLQQIAETAAAAIGDTQIISVEAAPWTLGIPAAAYQLRLGAAAMHIAFADQTHPAAAPAPSARENIPDEHQARVGKGADLLLDVELEASLRFGSREMSLNEVLDLGPGDVVELDRHISEPVDLLVGDKIVARGEVVLLNGNFGFSVLEVAEAEKRLESIRCLF
jgi:flagellar motor switch protein FliN